MVALFTSTATITLGANPAENGKQVPAAVSATIAKTYPFRGTVSTADPAAKTVSFAGRNSTRTVHVAAFSQINKDGHDITLAELQTGDYLKGLITKDATGRETVVKASAGEKPEPKARVARSTKTPKTGKNPMRTSAPTGN